MDKYTVADRIELDLVRRLLACDVITERDRIAVLTAVIERLERRRERETRQLLAHERISMAELGRLWGISRQAARLRFRGWAG